MSLHEAVLHLKSVSPYSMSKFYDVPKLPKETYDAFEARTWRERCHYLEDGSIYIPQMAFKFAFTSTAKFMGLQIPGKGKSTYTKHFEAGIFVAEPIILPDKKDEIKGEWFHVPADGQRGGSKRVMKCFPVIPSWEGDLKITILDDTITREVLLQHAEEMGRFNGIGRFRPQTGGFYGRFEVTDMQWS